MNQIQMVSLEDLVAKDHPYRKLKKLLNFNRIIRKLKLKQAGVGATGYGKERLVYCLLLQFMENLSDRECERYLRENTAGKWFAGFSLTEETPDYSTLCKFRNAMGSEGIERLFRRCERNFRRRDISATRSSLWTRRR